MAYDKFNILNSTAVPLNIDFGEEGTNFLLNGVFSSTRQFHRLQDKEGHGSPAALMNPTSFKHLVFETMSTETRENKQTTTNNK